MQVNAPDALIGMLADVTITSIGTNTLFGALPCVATTDAARSVTA